MSEKHSHVYAIFIRTTPEKLWQALTDGTMTPRYFYGSTVTSTWEKGAPYLFTGADGASMVEGEVLEVDPPHKLVTTFRPQYMEEGKKDRSVLTYLIEPKGDVCKLTLTHDNPDGPVDDEFKNGWAEILSGLKTFLETGKPLAAMATM